MAQTKHPQAMRSISHGHLGLAQRQIKAVGTSEEDAGGGKPWVLGGDLGRRGKWCNWR